MPETSVIENNVRDFVLKQFPLARKNGLKPNDKWLENGMLDSLGILDLVTYLENEFSIQAADDELVPENFESLAAVVDFAQKKISTKAGER